MNFPPRTKESLPGGACCRKRFAFSLTEVVIALGIVSFALIAIVGLIPLGLNSLKDSVSDSTMSLLISNIRGSLAGQPFKAGTLDPLYYESSARLQGTASDANSYYRVDVTVAEPGQSIPNANLLVATLKISWPVSVPEANRQSYVTSVLVSPLTGAGWSSLDSTFEPKIEL